MAKKYGKGAFVVDTNAQKIARTWAGLIAACFQNHTDHARYPNKVVQISIKEGDGGTPFAIHPTWCAMTILYEQVLPREVRELGARVLLFHDQLEDTKAPLPKKLGEDATRYVTYMTFRNYDEQVREFSNRGETPEGKRLLRLFSLYDKTSSLLHSRWSTRADHYAEYTLALLAQVEKDGWEDLNIFHICRALASKVIAESFADKTAEALVDGTL